MKSLQSPVSHGLFYRRCWLDFFWIAGLCFGYAVGRLCQVFPLPEVFVPEQGNMFSTIARKPAFSPVSSCIRSFGFLSSGSGFSLADPFVDRLCAGCRIDVCLVCAVRSFPAGGMGFLSDSAAGGASDDSDSFLSLASAAARVLWTRGLCAASVSQLCRGSGLYELLFGYAGFGISDRWYFWGPFLLKMPKFIRIGYFGTCWTLFKRTRTIS